MALTPQTFWPRLNSTGPFSPNTTSGFPKTNFPIEIFYYPRNASPKRKKNSRAISALLQYMALNKSTLPLQTNYLKADNDNDRYAEREEGDPQQLLRDTEAEMEMRPSPAEMMKLCDCDDIECFGFRKAPEYEEAARQSLGAFWRRQATTPDATLAACDATRPQAAWRLCRTHFETGTARH